MPNRVFREGWLRSRRLAATSADGERMFVRLGFAVDDYGRFSAEPAIVRPACFPRSLERHTEAQVKAWLDELAQRLLIGIYQAGADRLLQLFNFGQRVRARSKYPAPPLALLDALGEPSDSPARADCARAAVSPLSDGGQTAAVVVVEDVVVGGGGIGAHRPPAPFQVPGLRAVEEPGAPLQRPPQPGRPPEYVLTCQDCSVMLRTLNELTGRLYSAPGRSGEWMHMAHDQQGLDKALRTIRAQVESIGQRPGKTRFLAPKILFEPSNWDVSLNALDGGGADRDALPPLRV